MLYQVHLVKPCTSQNIFSCKSFMRSKLSSKCNGFLSTINYPSKVSVISSNIIKDYILVSYQRYFAYTVESLIAAIFGDQA